MLDFLKTHLVEFTNISKDALHVHIGLLIFFGAKFVFRQPATSLAPWLAVLALELVNEAVDLFYRQTGAEPLGWTGSARDILNTMLWPTVLIMLARTRAKPSLPSVTGKGDKDSLL